MAIPKSERLAKHIQNNAKTLDHNCELFEIYEGDLLKYLKEDLAAQLSSRAYQQVQHRIAPINILKRLISKLSKIYAKPPKRTIVDGNQADQELLDWYVKTMDFNVTMGLANEFFNMFKNTLVEPYLYNSLPYCRVCPSDRFLPYSDNVVMPTIPTEILKYMGKYVPEDQKTEKGVWLVYSDSEIYAIDSDGKRLPNMYPELVQMAGINPVGKIPLIYINRSKHELIPSVDSDTLKMTKLMPILLSDLNYAVMYQCFSIIYTIDVEAKNLPMDPSAMWMFKSDQTADTQPKVDVIKPEVDLDKVLQLVQTQMSMWFQSRNIKPGSIGQLTTENASSGIAKAIDEMDTSEDRSAQIPYFMNAEKEFWNLIMKQMHPFWIKDKNFPKKTLFTPGASVEIIFPEQRPLVDMGALVDEVIKELTNGLTTRERAIKKLNPDMDDKEIDTLIAEIEDDRTVNIDESQPDENPDSEDKQDDVSIQ